MTTTQNPHMEIATKAQQHRVTQDEARHGSLVAAERIENILNVTYADGQTHGIDSDGTGLACRLPKG